MKSRYLLFGLIGFLVFAIGFQPLFAATMIDSKIDKIKASVRKLSSGDARKVVVKMKNGTKNEGYIRQVLDDSFDLFDTRSKQTATIIYTDVSSVKRHGWPSGAKIALGIGIGAAVTIAVIAGIVSGKGLDGFCPLGCSTMLRR